MSELQHQTDVDMAKARLEEIEQTKEARRNPRQDENRMVMVPPQRRDATQEEKDKMIRPVTAKPKKPSFGQKLKKAMFSEDIGNGSVWEYILFRIFIPSSKRILSDMVNTAVNMALGMDPKTRTIGTTHVANASTYRTRYDRASSDSYRGRDSISDLRWDKATAEDIYCQMCDMIDTFGKCTIADAYSIMGQSVYIRTTDSKWGWSNVRDIDYVPYDSTEREWIIDVAPARPV